MGENSHRSANERSQQTLVCTPDGGFLPSSSSPGRWLLFSCRSKLLFRPARFTWENLSQHHNLLWWYERESVFSTPLQRFLLRGETTFGTMIHHGADSPVDSSPRSSLETRDFCKLKFALQQPGIAHQFRSANFSLPHSVLTSTVLREGVRE